MADAPKPADLVAKALAASGKTAAAVVRTGTLTAPDDVTHKVESKPVTFTQSADGKFAIVAGERRIVSNGKQSWYSGGELMGEPAAVFNRIGRAWRGDDYQGLDGLIVSGKDTVGDKPVVVVRGTRALTSSTEEMYFDATSGLLLRAVNLRRTPIGTVVSSIDYSGYKTVNGVAVPMNVVVTFGGDEKWVMEFKEAKTDSAVASSTFEK
jgi:hypothetical protein